MLRLFLASVAGVLALVISVVASAAPIGNFIGGVHEKVVIEFQFDPLGTAAQYLFLGIAGSGSPDACRIDLYDEGSLLSSAFVPNPRFACQGEWAAGSTPNSSFFSIATGVDLSGLAAGEAGRLELFPDVAPGASIYMDMPTLLLTPTAALSNLEVSLVEIGQSVPEPAMLGLFSLGLAGLAAAGRRRRAT